MEWRLASAEDSRLLAELNHQLIADEGHRNPMNVSQLEQRMLAWLNHEYRAALFSLRSEIVSYALYRNDDSGRVHLRQFFVVRHLRRKGIGREALRVFRTEIIPPGLAIVLEVLIGNQSGRAFWNANGFREYAVTLECVPEEYPGGQS
jgi:GNAT superfamily N-acetyltransferase